MDLADTISPEKYQQDKSQPWYRSLSNNHSFKLFREISLGIQDAPTFRSLSCFPWDSVSLESLWDGDLVNSGSRWEIMVAEYWDTVAVTSDSAVYIFFTQQKRPPLTLSLPRTEDGLTTPESNKMCVSWAINPDEGFEPLVVFSKGSLLYIFNVDKRQITGQIRGHGGAITSIAVHPTSTHLICTTSRDYSARLYDLRLDATAEAQVQPSGKKCTDRKDIDPHSPFHMNPCLSGAAYGLRLPFFAQEGVGKGKCICVFMAGRSGGHRAAVLSAAFHPHLPLIATCGADRAVKIWPIHQGSEMMINCEPTPLFSTSMIHRARVISINWLEDNLLITHSAPAIMRLGTGGVNSDETFLEAGELTIWKWLGLGRFFPGNEKAPPSTVLRGISSDYQESVSFEIVSTQRFPIAATQLCAPSISLFHGPAHDPILLINHMSGGNVTLLNAAHMCPRLPPTFQGNPNKGLPSSRTEIELVVEEEITGWRAVRPQPPIPRPLPPLIRGWVLHCRSACSKADNGRRVMDSAMGREGRMVAAVGTSGTLWVWMRD